MRDVPCAYLVGHVKGRRLGPPCTMRAAVHAGRESTRLRTDVTSQGVLAIAAFANRLEPLESSRRDEPLDWCAPPVFRRERLNLRNRDVLANILELSSRIPCL